MKPICGDYGMECPECGSGKIWDRVHGDCYMCDNRGRHRQSNIRYYLSRLIELLHA